VTVYLVGAGPGDPRLITVRGRQLLEQADVVVYDRLAARSLLDLTPPAAERINVGKEPGNPRLTQDEINVLLVERGQAGGEVVRLKGGDPFVFARGGEEAAALAAAGVPFEIVPGVSSAIAAPAYAGIPITMRHSSTLFTVITGHEDPDKGGELDWEAVAKLGGTIVVLMGIGRLPKIVDRLMAGGLAADTPVTSIQWGTRPDQQTVRATLGSIAEQDLEPPATIVIGKVAEEQLTWFETKPLFGKKVVVTRAASQASSLVEELLAAGAEPIEVPVLEIAEPADGGEALRDAAANVRDYDWLVVTSANGADRFMRELRDARDLADVKVAAIGPATADALRAHNIEADLVPDEYVAESLVAAFPPPDDRGSGRVLLARAATAREVLPTGLTDKGWKVDVVEAYRTHTAEVTEEQRVEVAGADVVTFTSSSTVTYFLRAMRTRDAIPPVVACIGPITSATAKENEIHVDIEASVFTMGGLVDALTDHFDR
jgi:uroporphyrinogen III methyltransferase/synthase